MLFAPKFQTWIKNLVETHDALSGTVHLYLKERLELAAAIDFPLKMQQEISKVEVGNGFVGAAMEQGKTLHAADVDGTHLQPGAVDAVAIPVADNSGGYRAVIVVSFENEISDEVTKALELEAQGLPPF